MDVLIAHRPGNSDPHWAAIDAAVDQYTAEFDAAYNFPFAPVARGLFASVGDAPRVLHPPESPSRVCIGAHPVGMDLATLAMPSARTADHALVPAEDIDGHLTEWATPLRCPDPNCPCPVEAVHSFFSEKSHHRAHFRPGKNAAHSTGCRYHAPQRIDKLIDQGLTEKRRQVYRTVLPETLQRRSPPTDSAGAEQHYTEQLTKLVNSAAIVADLLERFDQDEHGSDLAAYFELRCGDQTVEWLNFCYTQRRSITLARRVRTNEQRGTDPPPRRDGPGYARSTADSFPPAVTRARAPPAV